MLMNANAPDGASRARETSELNKVIAWGVMPVCLTMEVTGLSALVWSIASSGG